MKYPKISIVTPSFNQSLFIEQTILSVINQNYPNLEYIIIDGGSIDGSVDIIKKYEKYLAYWVSEKDNGLYHALQKGFEKSTGEIMGWINSDDKYHPNSFNSIAEVFSSFKELNWVTGCLTQFDEQGRTINAYPSKKWSKYDYYTFNYEWIQQESTVWRRILWTKAGNYISTKLKFASDLELWLRFFRYDKLFVADFLIGGFRLRSANQISLNHIKEYTNEAETIINNEILSTQEKSIIKKYYRVKKISSFIRKFKFLRTNWIETRFKNKYFGYPPRIYFNRDIQQFELQNPESPC